MPSKGSVEPVFADILGWAKGIATSQGASELDAGHILMGALRSRPGRRVLSQVLEIDEDRLASFTPGFPEQLTAASPVTDRHFDLAPRLRQITDELWQRYGELSAEQLLRAVLERLRVEEPWVKQLWALQPRHAAQGAADTLRAVTGLLDEATRLRQALAARVIGQERAIEMVCDAFFASGLRRSRAGGEPGDGAGPRMIFTFLGPPGVGKTYLAEILARHLSGGDSPALLRLDMSAYAGHQAHEQLVGFNPSYMGADRGLLTGFALDHPDGFVIVDEIEKAHLNTQNLFLQLLDSARLYDNNLRREVDFRGTIVIFTTNLGREIYDAPERAGILHDARQLNEAVVQALRREPRGPGEASAGLAPELLSRLAKGAIVLFGRLSGLALERIADLTVRQVDAELRAGVGLSIEAASPLVLTLLVLRLGASGDARRLTTGLRNYLYTAVRDLLHDHREILLGGAEPLLTRTQGLRLTIAPQGAIPQEITAALSRRGRILLLDDDRWPARLGAEFDWQQVSARDEADAVLRHGQIDLVLLDLHIGSPAGAGDMEAGLALLRWLRGRFPQTPVYLFSESPERRGLRPETLERVSAEGGAHGILQKRFYGSSEEEALERTSFFRQLGEVIANLQRQRLIESYQRRLTVVEFDTQLARLPAAGEPLDLALLGLREITAVAAQDRELAAWVDLPRDRLADIAGAEQAKQRLAEVVAWLSDPRPVLDMGLDLPKGILLTGPPGTGKTSLARAVAGESRVPFFAITGSAVFHKYVGESEAVIRNLFAVARRYAPAVVFIDEIDALGGQRSAHGEQGWRVGVLNELLAQMDGFSQEGRPVFVMAATNRPDILDPALVRPGRFDLQIEVPLPNAPAREAIFAVHLRGLQCAPDVAAARLAARTAGMSGADIKQVCKEAGFFALRAGSAAITQGHLDEAVTVVRFGLSSERVLLDAGAKWSTAVHEAGHALAQQLLFPDEPVSQISILPRGRALGFTEHLPGKYYADQNRKRIRGLVQVLLAGRGAEELLLGPDGITSGCAEDLERASTLALEMTAAWGMDAEVGLLSLPGVRRALAVADGIPYPSAHHDRAIAAARSWLEEQAVAVKKLLEAKQDLLRRIAVAVAEQESLGGEALIRLLGTDPATGG